jgi:hypothetical protein
MRDYGYGSTDAWEDSSRRADQVRRESQGDYSDKKYEPSVSGGWDKNDQYDTGW